MAVIYMFPKTVLFHDLPDFMKSSLCNGDDDLCMFGQMMKPFWRYDFCSLILHPPFCFISINDEGNVKVVKEPPECTVRICTESVWNDGFDLRPIAF